MKEKVEELVGNRLDKLAIWIDDVYMDNEAGMLQLHIVLDADRIIPMGDVVMATRIINPILDQADFIKEQYILDIYAKSKGEDQSE